ncbi:unknown protein (Partial), partial [Seminavis robusta]|eukprot:Sro1190_g250870.1 n/a (580) ;mRNA; f:32891-34631
MSMSYSSSSTVHGKKKEDSKSSSSSSGRSMARAQQIEAALSDLESSFERDSHSARYTSHVLDIRSNSNNSGADDIDDFSITSRPSSAGWFDDDDDPDAGIGTTSTTEPITAKSDSNDDSMMINLWQRQQDLRETVDQSVNLMDPKAAKYEGDALRSTGLEGFRDLKKKNSRYSNKGDSFSFPFLPSGFGDLQLMETEIKRRVHDPQKQQQQDNNRAGWKWILLVTCFFVVVAVSVTVTVIVVEQQHSKATHSTQEYDGAVKTILDTSSAQEKQRPGVGLPSESRSWDDDAMNSVGSDEGETAPPDTSSGTSRSHDYEVITNKDNIPMFRPTTVTLPAKTRARAMLALLLEFQVSPPDTILGKDKGSAAYRALQWIADEDPAKLPFPHFYYQSAHTAKLSRHDQEQPEWRDDSFAIQQLLQRYAMAVFYYSLEKPHTTDEATADQVLEDTVAALNHEKLQQSWLTKDHLCHWRGIDCGTYDHGGKAGVESIHMSSVVSINLTRHHLYGTLPPEWFSGTALPDLASVDLSGNHLHGSLPDVVSMTPRQEDVDNNSNQHKITTGKAEYTLRFPQNTNSSLVSS